VGDRPPGFQSRFPLFLLAQTESPQECQVLFEIFIAKANRAGRMKDYKCQFEAQVQSAQRKQYMLEINSVMAAELFAELGGGSGLQDQWNLLETIRCSIYTINPLSLRDEGIEISPIG